MLLKALVLHSQIPSAALKSSWAWTQQVQTILQSFSCLCLFEGSRVGRTSTTALPIRHAPQSLRLALSNSQRSTEIKLGLDSTSAENPSAAHAACLFEGSRVGRASTTAPLCLDSTSAKILQRLMPIQVQVPLVIAYTGHRCANHQCAIPKKNPHACNRLKSYRKYE